MSRTTRIYAPRMACHIVGVTQGRERWFTEAIRRSISDDVDEAAIAGGHRVLARVVMPNHFHIILKHGASPLAWTMQRVMQRAAFRVRKLHGVEGHVFRGRYWAEQIPTSRYLRRAIVYTHLNPCKAGLTEQPSDYAWSTHNNYLALANENENERDDAGALDGLMVFADENATRRHVVANYLRFVEFCQERRRAGITGDWLLPGSVFFDDVPLARHGDALWADSFAQAPETDLPSLRIDVNELAVRTLRRIAPDLDLDALRYGRRRAAIRDVTAQLVCALLGSGCRPSVVSRCLRISPSVVSRLGTAMRYSATPQR